MIHYFFYNPFAFLYLFLTVMIRFLLGKQRSNTMIKRLHWETFPLFLDWMRLPEYVGEALTIKDIRLKVKRKHFGYEPKVSSVLTRLHGHVFVDVGANVGYYSFLLHDNFDEIIAVEPHPKTVRVIQKAKEKHGYHKVTVVPKAVSNETTKTKLYLASHSGEHSLLQIRNTVSSHITVETVTLDSLLGNYGNLDLIKVDVERAEFLVLDGANQVFSRVKRWLVELHDSARKHDLEELLESKGYKIKWLDRNHVYAWRKK